MKKCYLSFFFFLSSCLLFVSWFLFVRGFLLVNRFLCLKVFRKKKSKLEIALIPSIYTTTYLIFNIIIAAYVWDKQVRECISIAFMTVYDQSISMFWRPLICLKIKAQAYIMLTICLILGDFSAQICLQSLCL